MGQVSVLVSVHADPVLFVGPVELVVFLAHDQQGVCAVLSALFRVHRAGAGPCAVREPSVRRVWWCASPLAVAVSVPWHDGSEASNWL